MKLEGVHHITAITADAQRNVDFYVGVLGLRMVKKTVNQDDPSVYHLFYADEEGSAGADITFFEFPGATSGRAGAEMVHQIGWRVGSAESLDFWAQRLSANGIEAERDEQTLTFADPEGLGHQLRVLDNPDAPLIADHPEVPRELALQGFDGARAYATEPSDSRALLERLGFEPRQDPDQDAVVWESRGDQRGGLWAYDPAPDQHGLQGAGTVHHIAWASTMDDHEAWRAAAAEAGMQPTPVIDRFWFRSVYFREPSGVLFEIATLGPGFGVDESIETLGQKLVLPPNYERLRDQIEAKLTPIQNPRVAARS